MPITKLTKTYLPTFIYIADLIMAEEEDLDYGKIAEEGVGHKKEIDARTIKRAFDLREELAKDALEIKVYKPSIKTLNTLTAYYFDNTQEKFLTISKRHKKEIEEHYKKNTPKPTVIQSVFNTKPEKIQFLEQQKNTYGNVLSELNNKQLDSVFVHVEQNLMDRFEAMLKKVNDDLALKTDIISHLELKVEELQRTIKQASFMHNTLGAIGLFFVSINYDPVSTESILEDFMDNYDGVIDEDILDDIL